MKHRRNRRRFSHAPKTWRFRAPVASAAVLAVATASGIVATQWHGSAARAGAMGVALADIGVPGLAGGGAGPVLSAPHRGESPLRSGAATARASRAMTSARPVAPETAASSASTASAPPPPPGAPVPPPLPTPAPSKVLSFQYQAQINGYYCGPAATRIALTARGKFPSQGAVAAVLGTTTSGTNSAADTTRALNSILGETTYQTHLIPGNAPTPAEAAQFQSDVVRAIGSGYAVVANIVGAAVDAGGAAHSYGNGHFLTVVGYRERGGTVKVADPANPAGDGTYWMTTANFANWMGHRGYSA